MKQFLLIFLLYGTFLQAQNTTAVSPSNEFSYNEFLGYVKKYHPLVKNAASGYKMPGAPRTNRADVAAVMLDQLNNKSSYKQKLIMCSKQED